MNNNRLSTSKTASAVLQLSIQTPLNLRESLLKEIAIFLEQPSNYRVNEEGRLFIISLNRYRVDNKAKAVQLVEVSSGYLLATFNSVNSCAKYLGVALSTAQRIILKYSHFPSLRTEGKTVFIRVSLS